MKNLILVAAIMAGIAGTTMAQTHPAKKISHTTTKTEVSKDSVGNATASNMNKHKAHKKGIHKKQ